MNDKLDQLLDTMGDELLAQAAKRAVEKLQQGRTTLPEALKVSAFTASGRPRPKRVRKPKAEVATATEPKPKRSRSRKPKPAQDVAASTDAAQEKPKRSRSRKKKIVVGATDKNGTFQPLDTLPPQLKDLAERVNEQSQN